MINSIKTILILLIFVLAGCSELKQGLGIEKKKPDEFLIKKINPIVQPPDYNLLPPDGRSNKNKTIYKPRDSSEDIKKLIDNNISKNRNQNSKSKSDSSNSSDIDLEIIKKLETND